MSTTINYNGTSVVYDDGDLALEKAISEISVNEGKVSLSPTSEPNKQLIYNGKPNWDGEGSFNGIKINCNEGLRIRTGDNGDNPMFEVAPDKVEARMEMRAPKFIGAFQVGDVTDPPTETLKGMFRYVEVQYGSKLEMCMKKADGSYEWNTISENI